MRNARLIVGLVLVLVGLGWAAQGAGIFPYPASSFMINDTLWVYIGLGTAVLGIALIVG
ncbi:MAG: hypothetical protein JO205_09355 [Pseudolabrys sp.]|nr:hypothetical protein [Pseudolabrys sp.]MBV9261564.1 hypothetical protein [Pseudolabrys sp.]